MMANQPILRPIEKIKSQWNSWMLEARQRIQFQRLGYTETGEYLDVSGLLPEARRLLASLENVYGFRKFQPVLEETTYLKNLATLWTLEQMLPPQFFTNSELRVLEPGCQDFARLPGILSYLEMFHRVQEVEGIELDPYPILHNFHSRADKAEYYISLVRAPAKFRQGNFFHLTRQSALVLSFYPFVSPHPAMAWGLPAHFGNAQQWVAAFDRCTTAGGACLVVHQGDWEEKAFDRARDTIPNSLHLVTRKVLDCPFYPLPYPAHASVYQKGNPT